MDTYEIVPIIDIFFKGNEDDNLIASMKIRNVPIEELQKIFAKEKLDGRGDIPIKKKHEELLRKLCDITINTSKCDAFIGLCYDNDPSRF